MLRSHISENTVVIVFHPIIFLMSFFFFFSLMMPYLGLENQTLKVGLVHG